MDCVKSSGYNRDPSEFTFPMLHSLLCWILRRCFPNHPLSSDFLNRIFKSYFLFLQLNMAKKKEEFLKEFKEGPLQFKPTYKFDLDSEIYDTR